ncbi:MAG: hypothetical protein M3X11_06655, partial [Acidobacteriota bacterium]|nr:hypothetical protein [Acidobacteriota bacterium]
MLDVQVDIQVPTTVLEKLRAAFADDVQLALIAADVDRVQSYVFESAKLAEMRGASLILDLLNVKDSNHEDWGDVEIEGQAVTGIRQMLADEFSQAVVIYTSGGGAMIVSELDQAGKIKKRIEQLYVEMTLTATITVVYEPVRLADLEGRPASTAWINTKIETAYGEASRLLKDNSGEPERGQFSELYALLGYRLRREKQKKLTAPIFEVSSFTERCGYCHFRPAFTIASEIDERPICQVCGRKRQDQGKDDRFAQSFYINGFKKHIENRAENKNPVPYQRKWIGVQSPPDLEAIAEAADKRASNFVGIIYADGNDMGAQLERLKTADDLECFANEVRMAMEQAVFSGLGNLLDGPRKTERKYKKGRKRTHTYHPFEIITIGGDDV